MTYKIENEILMEYIIIIDVVTKFAKMMYHQLPTEPRSLVVVRPTELRNLVVERPTEPIDLKSEHPRPGWHHQPLVDKLKTENIHKTKELSFISFEEFYLQETAPLLGALWHVGTDGHHRARLQ